MTLPDFKGPVDWTRPIPKEEAKAFYPAACAYAYKHCGEEGLRYMLDKMCQETTDEVHPNKFRFKKPKEWLEDWAQDLDKMNLSPVADIVREYAAKQPTEADNEKRAKEDYLAHLRRNGICP